MMRNAITVLMCSRGTPMIYAGDEFGNTQYGNNNAYCQDNEISWLNWDFLKKNREFYLFYKYMVQFRRKHAAIRKDLESAKSGLPFVSVHTENPDNGNITKDSRVICVRFAGFDEKKGHDDIVYLAINAYWEDIQIMLPNPPNGAYWGLCVDTGGDEDGKFYFNRPKPLTWRNKTLKARSVSVFIASYGVEYGNQ